MSLARGWSEEEITAVAEALGIHVAWEVIDPVRAPDGGWDLDRTVEQNMRTAENEFGWAITDQVNAGSDGYYPRGMCRSARMAHSAAVFSIADDRLVSAERKRHAAKALRKVLEALSAQGQG